MEGIETFIFRTTAATLSCISRCPDMEGIETSAICAALKLVAVSVGAPTSRGLKHVPDLLSVLVRQYQ